MMIINCYFLRLLQPSVRSGGPETTYMSYLTVLETRHVLSAGSRKNPSSPLTVSGALLVTFAVPRPQPSHLCLLGHVALSCSLFSS